MESMEFWKKFTKIARKKNNDMSPRNIQGLLIGSWQADHGLSRAWASFGMFRRPKWFWGVVNWFATLFVTIKWDIERLWRQKKSKEQ
jgi:hypothetical protein